MPCYQRQPDGLLLTVRVTPNAATDRIEAIKTRDDGTGVLALRVRAVPDKGAANKAVIALIAKDFDLPKSRIRLTAGSTSRQKRLHLTGDPDRLIATLFAL